MNHFAVSLIMIVSQLLTGCASYPNLSRSSNKILETSFVHVVTEARVRGCFTEKVKVDLETEIDVESCIEESPKISSSGVLIGRSEDNDYVLTAGHSCVFEVESSEMMSLLKAARPDAKITVEMKITLISFWGETSTGRVIKSNDDPTNDLCLIESEYLDGSTPAELASTMPVHGDWMFNAAAPLGMFEPRVVPIFSGHYSGISESRGFLISTIPARPGSSGSGMFDSDFKLIGIIVRAHPQIENISLGIQLKTISEFLDENIPVDIENEED